MFEVWDRIYQLHKQDKYVCSLLMILVLINPDRQMPAEIKTELDRIDQIQDQYTEGNDLITVSRTRTYPRTPEACVRTSDNTKNTMEII